MWKRKRNGNIELHRHSLTFLSSATSSNDAPLINNSKRYDYARCSMKSRARHGQAQKRMMLRRTWYQSPARRMGLVM